MSVIDIVLGSLLLFGLVRGFIKGLFVEVASLVALVAGVYGAIHFSYFVSNFIESKTEWTEKTINIAAFALTFIVIIIIISFAGKALTKLANFASLGILNKLLGGVFGALKIGLILSILLMFFNKINNTINLVDENQVNNSILFKPVSAIAPMIFSDIIRAEVEDKNN